MLQTTEYAQGHTRRHHRTATLQQRRILHIMKAPVYTIRIDPQTDRGMLCDFYEAIKNWAATYTINTFTFTASQLHDLTLYPALTSAFGSPARIRMLVGQIYMLAAMVSSIISRLIFTRTIDENALYLSCHPHAWITQALADQRSSLSPTDAEGKEAWCASQKGLLTALPTLSGYHSWCSTCAEYFSTTLTSSLSSLLNTYLSTQAIRQRDYVLQELFVKGY